MNEREIERHAENLLKGKKQKHKSQPKKKEKKNHPFCRKLVLIALSFSHLFINCVVINTFCCSAWVISQLFFVLDFYLVSTSFLQLPICEPLLLQLHSLFVVVVIARHPALAASLSLFPTTLSPSCCVLYLCEIIKSSSLQPPPSCSVFFWRILFVCNQSGDHP
jgi:hypothetical protein